MTPSRPFNLHTLPIGIVAGLAVAEIEIALGVPFSAWVVGAGLIGGAIGSFVWRRLMTGR